MGKLAVRFRESVYVNIYIYTCKIHVSICICFCCVRAFFSVAAPSLLPVNLRSTTAIARNLGRAEDVGLFKMKKTCVQHTYIYIFIILFIHT